MSTLIELTVQLDRICDDIDASEELPADLIERFTNAQMDHSQKVAAYVNVLDILKKEEAYYAERAATLAHRSKVARRVTASIKERLMYMVKQFPDLPFKSPDGDKIAIRNNPESLQVDVPLDHRHVNNVINETDLVPVQFINVVTLYTLNTDAVRAHLKAGGELSWARMTRGSHLRVY